MRLLTYDSQCARDTYTDTYLYGHHHTRYPRSMNRLKAREQIVKPGTTQQSEAHSNSAYHCAKEFVRFDLVRLGSATQREA
jgi:hypothetical protein